MRGRETAWAIEIEPENYQAIISEGGKHVNKEFLERWMAKYPEGGYFVRDVEHPRFDCTTMTSDHFFELYKRVERTVCDPDSLSDGLVECNGAHFFPIEAQDSKLLKRTA